MYNIENMHALFLERPFSIKVYCLFSFVFFWAFLNQLKSTVQLYQSQIF